MIYLQSMQKCLYVMKKFVYNEKAVRWLWKAPLEFYHSHSDGQTVSYGRIIVQIYRSWHSDCSKSRFQIIVRIARLLVQGHGVQYPQARCISNVSDCFIQLSRNIFLNRAGMRQYCFSYQFVYFTLTSNPRTALISAVRILPFNSISTTIYIFPCSS